MKHVVVAGNGPPCPGCGRATQIREHDRIRSKQLRAPFYFRRWFCCVHNDGKTTIVLRDEFKVVNKRISKAIRRAQVRRAEERRRHQQRVEAHRAAEERREERRAQDQRFAAIRQQLRPRQWVMR